MQNIVNTSIDNTIPVKETKKRVKLANEISEIFDNSAIGVVLTGSVAYSANYKVTEDSDIDLLVVMEELRKGIPFVTYDKTEQANLENRVFEGYCVRKYKDDIPINLHIISEDAFDIISKCFLASIRVYRKDTNTSCHILKNFEGREYEYYLKNIILRNLKGVRTDIPISFVYNNRYFIGLHRDKLLSAPKILYDPKKRIEKGIDKLWEVVVKNLAEESRRIYKRVDLDRVNVLNALTKKSKMPEDVILSIKERTEYYLSRI